MSIERVVSTTTATNKKLSELLTKIRDEKLIPNPEFQRRLVWTNKDKVNFLRTVLEGYPFPEIYIASGDIDTDTGESTEMLVDGQQRMTTLFQYFTDSPELRLPKDVRKFKDLTEEEKRVFLNYIVVIRDLGDLSIKEIQEVFTRINSTKYSLNAMEINNARYEGEFKEFGERLAMDSFFDNHRVFNSADIRRMEDIKYTLTLVATLMSSYFNRDDELEIFLREYNDEFPEKEDFETNIKTIFDFIESCEFPNNLRVWKKADLFSLIVELYKSIIRNNTYPNPQKLREALTKFFNEVDNRDTLSDKDFTFPKSWVTAYGNSIFQATNDRSKRIERGKILAEIIKECS